MPRWQTRSCRSAIAWMPNSFVLAFSCCPTPFSLPKYSQSHTLSVFVFYDSMWGWWSNISNSCNFFLYLFFERINGQYLYPWIIKKRTPFACYRTILTFDLGYTKAEPSLLFILSGDLFWLIVRVIFTVFNTNIYLFISWKPYIVFVQLACYRCSNNLTYVELI